MENEIGILFDIDRLGDGFYSIKAFNIFFENIDHENVSIFFIYDGDTIETLSGDDNKYCIAVQSSYPETISYIKDVFTKLDDECLADLSERFIEGDVTSRHPFVLSASAESGIDRGYVKLRIDNVGISAGIKNSGWELIK